MNTFFDVLFWAGLLAGFIGLVWLYGSSWRAVARALAEAADLAAAPGPEQAEGSIVCQPADGAVPHLGTTFAVVDPPARVAGTRGR